MIIIGIPYSDYNAEVVRGRIGAAEIYLLELMAHNKCAIIPAAIGHHIWQSTNISNTFEYWENYCINLIKECSELHVLMLPGWENSKGLEKEINTAKEYNVPILYIEMPG